MELVTKSCGNALWYSNKTNEYIYTNSGKEIWRVISINGDLKQYFIDFYNNGKRVIDEEKLESLTEWKIWLKYLNSIVKS